MSETIRIANTCRWTNTESVLSELLKVITIGLTLLTHPAAAAAADDDTIVVTATRAPTPRQQLGSAVTVISSEEIQRKQFRTVNEALRTVPGLHVVQSGGVGQQTSVFMRGASSNHTLVLIDGIEISDPGSPTGAVDFANLMLENVERIEIVRGPQSTLYGSDAIGGVINIIMKRGTGETTASATLEIGSDSTRNPSVVVSGEQGEFNYSASASYLETDGDSVTPKRLRMGVPGEDDGYRNTSISSRLGWTPSDILEFNLVTRFVKSDTDIDPELFMFGTGTTEDRDAKLKQDSQFIRGDTNLTLLDGLWDASFATSYTNYDRKSRNDRTDPFIETLDHTDFEGKKLKFEIKNTFYVHDDHIATLGLETEKEETESSGFTDFAGFVISRDTDADARTNAVYLQDQFTYGERISGTVGARMDDHDQFGSKATWQATSSYNHTPTYTRLTGSIGTGYKAPSLEQLYGFAPNNFFSAFRGNPNLDPEESFSWDIGVEQALAGGRVKLGATFFKSKIDDLIQTIFLPSFDSTPVNIDEADIKGIETFATAQISPNIYTRIDYTYTDAEDDKGKQLLRRPRDKASLGIDYQPTPTASVSFAMEHIGRMTDIDRVTGSRIKPASYTVMDLTGTLTVNRNFKVFGKIKNLADKRYEPADGFEAPDRAFFAGIQATM